MFVPRTLRLKNAQSAKKQRDTIEDPRHGRHDGPRCSDTMTVEQRPSDNTAPSLKPRGPKFTTNPISDEYLSQLACAIELIFSDYAHQDECKVEWLKRHYRKTDGAKDFIHLSAFLDHPSIANMKPEASTKTLQHALEAHLSEHLELSENRYFVRRKPSTYPLPFIPVNSFDIVNDCGLSFWDQRTIYVEPHTRDLCKTPAKVAWWLKEHGQLREKWAPIQAVHPLYNSCAFVVLSGNVTHEDIWKRWSKEKVPQDWNILTKVEHTKRTEEYIDLLKKEKEDARSRREQDESSAYLSNDSTTLFTGVASLNSCITSQKDSRTVQERLASASERKPKRQHKNQMKEMRTMTEGNCNGDSANFSNNLVATENKTNHHTPSMSQNEPANKRIKFS